MNIAGTASREVIITLRVLTVISTTLQSPVFTMIILHRSRILYRKKNIDKNKLMFNYTTIKIKLIRSKTY